MNDTDLLAWLDRTEWDFTGDEVEVVGLVPPAAEPFDMEDPNTWTAKQLTEYQAFRRGERSVPGWAVVDYGIRAPAGATATQIDALAKFTARLYDAEKLRNLPKLEPLIDGWLYQGTAARLFAPPGSMKTFQALSWAAHVAMGREWHGCAVAQGPVLFLAGEGARGLRDRREAIEATYNDGKDIEGLFIGDLTFNMAEPGLSFVWALGTSAMHLGAKFVVVDTQARYTVGSEENSAKELGYLISAVDELTRFTGATVMLVHHVARGSDHGRGSTVVEGAMQSEFYLTKTEAADGAVSLNLRATKQKDHPERSIPLRPEPVGESLVLVAGDPGQIGERGDGNGGKLRPKLMQELSEHLAAEDAPMSRTALVARAHGRKEYKLAAVDVLIRLGYFSNDPVSNRLTLAEPYTADRGDTYACRVLVLDPGPEVE